MSKKERVIVLEENNMKQVNNNDIAILFSTKIDKLEELLSLQSESCTDIYNIGLYNGLALALGVLLDEEPKFFEEGGEKDGE